MSTPGTQAYPDSGGEPVDVLLRFEQAWDQSKTPPDIRAHRPADATPDLLLELAHIDLERRCRKGFLADVEEYARVFPELSDRAVESLRAAAARLQTVFETRTDFGAGRRGAVRPPDSVTIQVRMEALQPHAEGGLGEVLAANDPQLGRRVAVKLLQARWAGSARARQDFMQEARVTSRLEHPGIVPVHAWGRAEDGRPCYSMRFVEGQTLRAAIDHYHDGETSDPAARAVEFRGLLSRFLAVCNTVAYAHSRGVLHRDLKPENIMLGPFGETIVLDWGLARVEDAGARDEASDNAVEDPERTQQGEIRGTPAYLSPEQAVGDRDRIGPATDIFGLGATLYAILTGGPPYRATSQLDAVALAATADCPPPRQLERGVPAALDAVCRKAMARRIEDRYGAALDLAADVENWLAGEKVGAWREPWHVAARRALRRRRTLVAVLAALMIVVPILLGIGASLLVRAGDRVALARRTAQLQEESARDVTEYLRGIFASADPIGIDDPGFRAPRPEDTTRLMLDRGAKLVRAQVADPVVRADLLDAMGNAYRNLAEYDVAEAMLREGHELRLHEFGPDDSRSIDSLHSLARLAHDRGDYQAAEEQYRTVLAWRERAHGRDSLEAARVKFYLAWMIFYRPLEAPVFDEAQLLESERLFREVLAVREQHQGKDDPDVGYTLAGLAAVISCRHSAPKGEVLGHVSRALEIFRKSEQASGIGAIMIEFMLAEEARKKGDFATAEPKFLRVLDLARRNLGPRHPLVVMQLAALVGMYRQKGDMAAAKRHGYEALAIGRKLPLRSTPAMLDALGVFAEIVLPDDRAEAIRLYEEGLRYARERPEVNAPRIAAFEARLAQLRPMK